MKKLLAMLVTAAVIGAGGLAVASATDSPPASTTNAATPAASARAAVRPKIRKLVFTTAANAIGISPAELLTAMEGGHSIADVATAHGVNPQTVVNSVETTLDARIQQALTAGKITSAQATKLDQAVTTRVPKVVNASPMKLVRRALRAGAVNVSAKTIGVTPEALRQAIVSGQSVASVASAHNVAPATVVSALVTAGDARIDKAVANHHLSAADAAKLKARLPQLAQRFVDFTRKAGTQKATAAA